jgi:hypothetical protein
VSDSLSVPADPYPFGFDPRRTALLIIDMQRDFVEPGGFGETLGNDISLLREVIAPLRAVLQATRDAGITVIHTREGHVPDLSDCPPAKLNRGSPSLRIGDPGPKGRILIRGEYGHDIIDELASTSWRRCPANWSSTSRARAPSTRRTSMTRSAGAVLRSWW